MARHIWESQGYATLNELCQLRYYTSLGDSAYTNEGLQPPYNGFEALKDYPDLRKITEDKLASLGFRRFGYVGNGDFAVVLKTVDDQVVRISVDSEEHKRPKHPAIFQPRASFLLGVNSDQDTPIIRLEVLTQIKDRNHKAGGQITTNGITPEHVEILKSAIRESGLNPLDLFAKNIALLSDGTPIVIDGGAVLQQPNQPIIIDEQKLSRWMSVNQSGHTVWKQHALYPEIERGEITGGITPADIEAFGKYLGENNQLSKAAVEDGLYRVELAQLIADAGIRINTALARGESIDVGESFRLARNVFDRKAGPNEEGPKFEIIDLICQARSLYKKAAQEVSLPPKIEPLDIVTAPKAAPQTRRSFD